MIVGFENVTHPLTDDEKKLVPVFVAGLSKLVGKEKAMTNKTIGKLINEKYGYTLSEARVRKIIHHIRVNKLVSCIVASSRGYYVMNDLNALKQYKQSLQQRNSEVSQVIKSIEEDINALESKQQYSFNNF